MIRSIQKFSLALMLFTLMLTGCGGGSGGGNSGTSVSTNTLTGSTLVLQPDSTLTQPTSSSTYQFYAGGNCTYTFESLGLRPTTVTMQWQVEGDTLYINSGDRFSGSGMYRPQEWSFPQGLQTRAPAVAKFQTLEVKAFTPGTGGGTGGDNPGGPTGSTVDNDDLYGTAMAFSVEGSRNELDVHYFIFYDDGEGRYIDNAFIEDYEIQDILWDAYSGDGYMEIDYSDTKKGELQFLGDYAAGELFDLKLIGVGSFPVTTQYTILEVGRLEDLF